MYGSVNIVNLRGTLAGAPAFSHYGGGEEWYTFPLEVKRLSGVSDTLNIAARKRLLEKTVLREGDRVAVAGELRSFNNRSGVGSRLVITVLARGLEICSGEYENSVELTGVVCKEPKLRRTPMGRRICDIMLAVNRPYGRSDYIPVIAWGSTAMVVSSLPVGAGIALSGRLQSREYTKLTDDGETKRTAFEVSVVTLTDAG